MKRYFKQWFIFLIWAFFLDAVLTFSYHAYVVNKLGEFDTNLQMDAGAVFFGDYDSELEYALGPQSLKRVEHLLSLYQLGCFDTIYCVGGFTSEKAKKRGNLMYQYFIDAGISSHQLFYDSLSYNTITNLEYLRQLMKKHNHESVVIVSSPYHAFRIQTMLKEGELVSSYTENIGNQWSYWDWYASIHHEFISLGLNVLLPDHLRNRLVIVLRKIRSALLG